MHSNLHLFRALICVHTVSTSIIFTVYPRVLFSCQPKGVAQLSSCHLLLSLLPHPGLSSTHLPSFPPCSTGFLGCLPGQKWWGSQEVAEKDRCQLSCKVTGKWTSTSRHSPEEGEPSQLGVMVFGKGPSPGYKNTSGGLFTCHWHGVHFCYVHYTHNCMYFLKYVFMDLRERERERERERGRETEKEKH